MRSNDTTKKLNLALFKFRDIKQVDQLLTFYYSIVESKLRYGISPWGSSSPVSDRIIAKKKIIRYIASVQNNHLETYLNFLQLAIFYFLKLCARLFLTVCLIRVLAENCETKTS